jgi:hypothetical protein
MEKDGGSDGEKRKRDRKQIKEIMERLLDTRAGITAYSMD